MPEYKRLAKLTGLPDLSPIYNPERLERLVEIAWGSCRRLVPDCPLRYSLAYMEYAKLAQQRLENPEDLL